MSNDLPLNQIHNPEHDQHSRRSICLGIFFFLVFWGKISIVPISSLNSQSPATDLQAMYVARRN